MRISNVLTLMNTLGPVLHSVGGDMRADRFHEYPDTYFKSKPTAFININHEFYDSGYIKAFEAHVIRTGTLHFMVCFNTYLLVFLMIRKIRHFLAQCIKFEINPCSQKQEKNDSFY